jgi:hypothetical protein
VLDREPPFGHQFFNVPITEGVGEIPPHTLEDHILLNMPPLKDIVAMEVFLEKS